MTDRIFGHTWEDIQRAQSGGSLHKPLVPQPKPTASDADLALLAEIGLAGLKQKGLFGVIDRLKTSGHIEDAGGNE